MARKKQVPSETLTIMGLTLHLVNARRANNWDVVTVILFDANSVPLDQFDLYRHEGTWYAWTADTFNQARALRREELAAEYNRRKAC